MDFIEVVQALWVWWLLTGMVTLIGILVIMLKDDAYTLTTGKALVLVLVGIVDLIPLIKNFLPLRLSLDFGTRWFVLSSQPFGLAIGILGVPAVILGPIGMLLVILLRGWDHFERYRNTEPPILS